MFAKAKEGVTEEDYYLAEWTPEERSEVRYSWALGAFVDVTAVLACSDPVIQLVVLQAWQHPVWIL
jgi:hypothetical protein